MWHLDRNLNLLLDHPEICWWHVKCPQAYNMTQVPWQRECKKNNNYTWHSADQSTIQEALEYLRPTMKMRENTGSKITEMKAFVQPQWDILAPPLWSARQSVSARWSHYCRRHSRIIKASSQTEWTCEDRSQTGTQQTAGGKKQFSVWGLDGWRHAPFLAFLSLFCMHPLWLRCKTACASSDLYVCATVCMCVCKEDVEADPERLTHHSLQYLLTTRASWQHSASHTWQAF